MNWAVSRSIWQRRLWLVLLILFTTGIVRFGDKFTRRKTFVVVLCARVCVVLRTEFVVVCVQSFFVACLQNLLWFCLYFLWSVYKICCGFGYIFCGLSTKFVVVSSTFLVVCLQNLLWFCLYFLWSVYKICCGLLYKVWCILTCEVRCGLVCKVLLWFVYNLCYGLVCRVCCCFICKGDLSKRFVTVCIQFVVVLSANCIAVCLSVCTVCSLPYNFH
jgi:hypothetical protein